MNAEQPTEQSVVRTPLPLPDIPKAHRFGQRLLGELLTELPSRAIEAMSAEPEFATLLPELRRLRDVPQDPEHHPEGNVWIHTMLVIDEASKLAGDPRLTQFDRQSLLLGALLHDVGKGVEGGTQMKPDGHGGVKITARGHEKMGVAPSRQILERLGLEEFSAPVLAVVEHHMLLPGRFREVQRGNMTEERCIARTRSFLERELAKVNPLVLLNCTIADWRGRGQAATREVREQFIQGFTRMFG